MAGRAPLGPSLHVPRDPHGQPSAGWMPPLSRPWTTRREISLSLRPSTEGRFAAHPPQLMSGVIC